MKVAIYSRALDPQHLPVIQLFFDTLQEYGFTYSIYKPLADTITPHIQLKQPFSVFHGSTDLDYDVAFFISLGGDGTMLDAVTLIKNKPIALVGINFGRLGFLSTIGKDNFQTAIKSLANKTFISEKRTLVHVDANIPLFDGVLFGLNEFSIHKRDTASLLKIHTYINGDLLTTYWADGLIVSTPTGSTGYSLSCGGPIVFPSADNLIITAVAPHHLNVRSLVVKDDCIISFKIESRSDDFICALDSRKQIVPMNTELTVKKESFSINLVRLPENTFLNTIQTKLIWGLDKRN